MLTQLLLPIFRRTLLNQYAVPLYKQSCTWLVFCDVKFWQIDDVFGKFPSAIFCLICYCACAETATVVLLALILYKSKFSVPGFVLEFWPGFEPFWPLLVRMRRNGHKTTSGVKFDSIFGLSVPDFLYDENFCKLGHDFGSGPLSQMSAIAKVRGGLDWIQTITASNYNWYKP